MYPNTRWLYQRVHTSASDDNKIEDFQTESQRSPFYLSKVFLVFVATVSCSFLAATITYGITNGNSCHNPNSNLSTKVQPNKVAAEKDFPQMLVDTPRYQHTCGNSSTEAVENGCVFDRLTVSWQHPSCSQAATSDFLLYAGDRPYEYWLDQKGTQLLDENELAHLNERWYWSTKREHLAHCAFVILRFYKAIDAGERVDDLAGSTKHAHHCMKNFLSLLEKSDDWDDINTTGNIQYLSC
jgi:hypothetical protein